MAGIKAINIKKRGIRVNFRNIKEKGKAGPVPASLRAWVYQRQKK